MVEHTSSRRVLAGAVLALVIPIGLLVFAVLLENDLITLARDDSTLRTVMFISFTEFLLGPLGLWVAGSGAGVRGLEAWIPVFLFGVPALGFVWFVAVASVSGAFGSPA